ncbi:Cathepsin B [Bienertia sinuspersici]
MARRDEGDLFYFSWRNREYHTFNILSPIRDQHDIDPQSCPHHSGGAILEMQHRMKWAREGTFEEMKTLLIDIAHIVDKKPPVCSLGDVLRWLQCNGGVSNQGEKVFGMKDFEKLKPREKKGDLAKMIVFLFEKGPFAASFYVKSDFIPGQDIYLCEGQIIYHPVMKYMSHAVTVVGFGIDTNFTPFWEYMETDSPYIYTPKKDGFARIIATGFHKAMCVSDIA